MNKSLKALYEMACIEAGEKQHITYAKEIDHNDKVKEKYNLIKQYIEQLENENQKLKKTIEILKKYLFLADEKCLVWQRGYEHSTEVSDEDFEELKEVLE